jgi:aminopeptidase-like protein
MTIATAGAGEEIYLLAAELYPICRSITGAGVHETLARLARRIDLGMHEVATGTPVLDWTVPKEWVIRDAYIADAAGRRVVDFKAHNLHVLNYSAPVRTRLPLASLKEHIFTLPDQPDLIPYRTSYYAERWGFCMSHRALEALPEGEYEAVVDSELKDGTLVYGEYLHRGESEEEFLLSAHICHPSLANDNCSGLALLAVLAERLKGMRTRLSYRFIFAPGTIGSIAWLARNEDKLGRIVAGVVVSGVGDAGGPTYKRSRRGDALIDRAMAHAIKRQGPAPKVIDFFPYGYDERQYGSPGFDLPVGLLQRSQFATFPEYHTSADDLSFIAPEHLAASFDAIATGIEIVEKNRTLRNLVPKGEPQLGRRGLYGATGGDKDAYAKNMAMLWVLNLSDGRHSLLDIAERADLPFPIVEKTARVLEEHGLLAPA